MSDRDSTITDGQKAALRRLATLQRLREEARKGRRPAMLDSIEKLIDLETKMLRKSGEASGSKPT